MSTYEERMRDYQAEWERVMRENGHTPKMRDEEDGGGVDWFAMSYELHNGPMCAVCFDSWCYHCSGVDAIRTCSGEAP